MALLEYRCPEHGDFEKFIRRAGESATAPCPSCSSESKRVYSAVRAIRRQYDRQVDGEFGSTSRPKTMKRAGGGVAVMNPETGGYRPAITHNTVCPKEGKWRNVAVLGEFSYGRRVNCEACGYVWIHQDSTAANPLRAGVDETYRPPRRVFMDGTDRGGKYESPERGA